MEIEPVQKDFRAYRWKLPPEAFAIGSEEPDPPPSDLIDKNTWNSIVSLPDDVSIRTSDHYGSVLKKFWFYWGEWICLVGALPIREPESSTAPMAHVAGIAFDEFQASIHSALVGFYRLAFSSLRNVVEQMTIGLRLELTDDWRTFYDWLNGSCELRFKWAVDHIPHYQSVSELEFRLRENIGDDLFGDKTSNRSGGFARRLYKELCSFTHGQPGFTDTDIWQSIGSTQNMGPIFVPQSFEKWAKVFTKTYALGVLEAKLACPNINILAFGSSISIRDLFEQIVNLIPEGEDGATILRKVLFDWWQ